MSKKLNIGELARRYTTAVFDLAKSENQLDAVASELEKLSALLNEDTKLQSFLKSPLLKKPEQLTAVRDLAKSQKLSKLSTNLLLIIAQNGRLAQLPEIISVFLDKIAKENGEVKMQIITAEKLSAAQLKKISESLGKRNGKAVRLEQVVKSEILGGLIIKIGSQMFDYSIKSRLNKLKNKLQAAS